MARTRGICHGPVRAATVAAQFRMRHRGERHGPPMNTHSGEAIARAIACASGNGGAAVALANGLGDVPDDDDVDDLGQQLAALTEGLTVGEAMGEALAVGILAGRELASTFALRDLCRRRA
jgi:hypothetical protein